jgi:phosphatidylserine/phosphatidylglycerophosphate/cardiolipin synthase-like enzyme
MMRTPLITSCAVLVLALAACAPQYAPLYPPMGNPALQTFANPPPQYHGDLAVKFNHAYNALYEDNERSGHADPENPDKLFAKQIHAAQRSVDLAIFDIEEPSTCQALIAAAKRGVKVRILTDSDNVYESGSRSAPRLVHQQMRAAGIQIKTDNRTAFMHHKFAIVDQTFVITGSLNLTTYSMFRDNNNSLRIDSPQMAANYQAEFNRMFEQNMLGPNPHHIPYPSVKIDGATVRVLFSPKGGTKNAIIQTLQKARKRIRFMAFSMTDNDIQDVLVKKAHTGVKVEGIFDGCMISQYSVYHSLLTKNIPVLIDGNQALLHSKIMIIDDNTVITGSYNFSRNAEERNNENTLIIASAKVAGFYNKEFERLQFAALNNRVPPYDNRSCSSTDSGNDTELPPN